MPNRFPSIAAAVIVTGVLTAPAAAQTPGGVTLEAADAARWDASGLVSWTGVSTASLNAAPWDHWYGAADFAAIGGRYLTPNVKIELEASTSSEGHVYGLDERVTVPGLPSPLFRAPDHYLRSSSAGVSGAYQFFNNVAFHPYMGGGALLMRDERRTEYFRYDPRTPPVAPETTTSVRVRPMLTAGFKAYMSERVFFRTDARIVASSTPVDRFGWRFGIGVDF